MNCKITSVISLLIVFTLILIPSLLTPMQSDDYLYSLMGLSYEKHLWHYMNWSGRVVPDYVSSSMLSLLPKWAYAALNSLAFTVLILCISLLPGIALIDKNPFKPVVFLLIFVCYWIANPALGQTSFWIVGSANYLWTNMFIAIYLCLLTYASSLENANKKWYVVLALSGILAGCANENTSLVTVLIGISYLFIFNKKDNKKPIITGVIFSSIGAAIMLLSPGNAVRAEKFGEWYSLSLLSKAFTHFYERIPGLASGFWQIYLIIIVLFLIKSSSAKVEGKSKLISICLFFAFIISDSILMFAPGTPPRSNNGAFCFLLMLLAFILHSSIAVKNKERYYGVGLAYFFGLFYFVPSYLLFVNTMHATYLQEKIRSDIISYAKINNIVDVTIPQFYFPLLIKNSDKFDLYQSIMFAKYEGLNSIIIKDVNFDYSTAFYKEGINISGCINNVCIRNIYTGDRGFGLKPYIILELNKEPSYKDGFYFASIYDTKGRTQNVRLENLAEIKGRYFYQIAIRGLNGKEITNLNFGTYNERNEKIAEQLRLDFTRNQRAVSN
ncbi:DUF6056 family protein [Enterobacter cloacae]|uniref:DUF6056 family protein n=10 Tax=Enterobacter cloacae TaxID=550 RepID=UPI002A827A8A|nr:DUF6056 family protein [Enterobacter cloacae]